MKSVTFALVAASLGVAGAATPAFATSAEVKTETVSFADLDLSTQAGQETLDRRVNAAAKRVCDTNSASTTNRLRSYDARKCLAKARASARQQVATVTLKQQRGG
ncbi:MAG: UrcA family protein [Pseudomonadota bacterium]